MDHSLESSYLDKNFVDSIRKRQLGKKGIAIIRPAVIVSNVDIPVSKSGNVNHKVNPVVNGTHQAENILKLDKNLTNAIRERQLGRKRKMSSCGSPKLTNDAYKSNAEKKQRESSQMEEFEREIPKDLIPQEDVFNSSPLDISPEDEDELLLFDNND